MKPFRFFDQAAHARLSHLATSADAFTTDTDELARRVALCDRVRLVAPQDPDDWYEPELVLPPDADVDADRISLFTPVGLALLGRKCGDSVAWAVPAGMREMTIASVAKPVVAGN